MTLDCVRIVNTLVCSPHLFLKNNNIEFVARLPFSKYSSSPLLQITTAPLSNTSLLEPFLVDGCPVRELQPWVVLVARLPRFL